MISNQKEMMAGAKKIIFTLEPANRQLSLVDNILREHGPKLAENYLKMYSEEIVGEEWLKKVGFTNAPGAGSEIWSVWFKGTLRLHRHGDDWYGNFGDEPILITDLTQGYMRRLCEVLNVPLND